VRRKTEKIDTGAGNNFTIKTSASQLVNYIEKRIAGEEERMGAGIVLTRQASGLR
jgi:hypothetical protein